MRTQPLTLTEIISAYASDERAWQWFMTSDDMRAGWTDGALIELGLPVTPMTRMILETSLARRIGPTTYHVYWDEGDDPQDYDCGSDRADALYRARSISKRIGGSAYVVATDGAGRDTGQRVYTRGYYSHDDNQF